MRLNQYLQQAGIGSRREAERLVAAGAVAINGHTATPTTPVQPGDTVTVHGRPVTPQTAPLPRVFRLHKPRDYLVTARDPEGRATIYDLPALQTPGLPRLMPVGRLDVNSEGLLLLTTDGPLAERLMHPRTKLPRVYQVRVLGRLSAAQTAAIAKGLTVAGVAYQGAVVTPLPPRANARPDAKNVWYEIVLHEGKNREVRKIFGHFGLVVNRLVRVRYGPLVLGELPLGALIEVPVQEVDRLLKGLPDEATQAGEEA